MASAQVTLKVKTKIKWWFWPAVAVYKATCLLTQTEPDERVVLSALRRALLWKWNSRKWERVFDD